MSDQPAPAGTWRGSTRLWWELARPFSLTAAVVPVLTGTAFATLDGEFAAAAFVAMLVASVLIQAATNMFNEYYDYQRGVDTADSVGIAGALVGGGTSPRTVLTGGLLCFVVALAFGVYLIVVGGWPVLAGGAASAAAAYLYSGGPRPISATPFGELEVSLFMGPAIVLLAYFTQAGTLTWEVAYASLPIALLVAAILLANNLRDIVSDEERGRRTLAIVVGRDRGVVVFAAMLGGAYVAVGAGVAATLLPWTTLAVLATAPLARAQPRHFRRSNVAAELNAAVRGTAMLHARFGLLLAAAVFAWALLD